MKRLKQDYPGKDFCFVLGADLLDSLKAWDAPGVPDAGVRLWNECDFLVLDRPGYEIPDNLPPNFIELTALAGSKIVTEEVPSHRTRTRTPNPDPDPKPQTPDLGPRPRAQALALSRLTSARSPPPRSGGASASRCRSRATAECENGGAAARARTSASLRSTRSSRPCRAAATLKWSTACSPPPCSRTSSATASIAPPQSESAREPRQRCKCLRSRTMASRLTSRTVPCALPPAATRRGGGLC